jgi:hypothetical protein
MRRLMLLLGVIAAGAVAYILLFALAVEKPLTLGVVADYVARKRAILTATPGKRILVLAGSNGRFSHSCTEITRVTGVACVNLSISATIGLKYQVDAYRDALRPGDVVYMPLEYRDAGAFDPAFAGDERFLLLAREPARLLGFYPAVGVLKTIFSFDPRYLVSAVGEMMLDRSGYRRRFGLDSLDARGDEIGNDARRAEPYRSFVASLPVPNVNGRAQQSRRYWRDVMAQVPRLRERGAIVVGGLPTTFEEAKVSSATIDFMRSLYHDAGACFLLLPDHSLYPRAAFFDGAFHLQEAGQKLHSRLLAPALAQIARTGHC